MQKKVVNINIFVFLRITELFSLVFLKSLVQIPRSNTTIFYAELTDTSCDQSNGNVTLRNTDGGRESERAVVRTQ